VSARHGPDMSLENSNSGITITYWTSISPVNTSYSPALILNPFIYKRDSTTGYGIFQGFVLYQNMTCVNATNSSFACRPSLRSYFLMVNAQGSIVVYNPPLSSPGILFIPFDLTQSSFLHLGRKIPFCIQTWSFQRLFQSLLQWISEYLH
jgi:hypothetical protein